MTSAAPELSYESRIPSALQAGESVLWERSPVAPEPLNFTTGLLTCIGIVIGAGGFAALFTRDSLAIVGSTIIAAIVVALAAFFALAESLKRRRKHARSRFRITNRRVLRIDDTAKAACDELPISDLTHIEMIERDGGATARFFFADEIEPAVEFGGIETPRQVESFIIQGWSQAERRSQFRRVRPPPPIALPMTDRPPDIDLHSGEQIIWSGRPRPGSGRGELRRSRIIIALWSLVPLITLAAAAGMLRPMVGSMPALVIVIATVWVVIAFNAMFLAPRRTQRRRLGTSYVLTTTRAIVRDAGAPPTTHSYFLDIAKDAWFIEHRDGTGDVGIDVGVTFERIDNPAEVYAHVLRAVQSSGTIAPAPCATNSPSLPSS